jgi:hypothetical protein
MDWLPQKCQASLAAPPPEWQQAQRRPTLRRQHSRRGWAAPKLTGPPLMPRLHLLHRQAPEAATPRRLQRWSPPPAAPSSPKCIRCGTLSSALSAVNVGAGTVISAVLAGSWLHPSSAHSRSPGSLSGCLLRFVSLLVATTACLTRQQKDQLSTS